MDEPKPKPKPSPVRTDAPTSKVMRVDAEVLRHVKAACAPDEFPNDALRRLLGLAKRKVL